MILVDANILLYATTECAEAERAQRWLDSKLNGDGRVGLPWASLLAFLRLITNSRIYPSPVSLLDAWAQVEDWLESPNVWIPSPTERHASILRRMLEAAGGGRNLVPDADLAALAIEHGLLVCSTDRDFSRFPGVRWENPLARDLAE
ncbi:MAG TPA: type II toxin-antitoxin system VapC family toxin [Bryobacteraceae bacterium]|nr:type II toxin-antitoxin system VapC family toxin [Bryobacteraceae bacterium]